MFLMDCGSLWIETAELEYAGITQVEYGEGGGEGSNPPSHLKGGDKAWYSTPPVLDKAALSV